MYLRFRGTNLIFNDPTGTWNWFRVLRDNRCNPSDGLNGMCDSCRYFYVACEFPVSLVIVASGRSSYLISRINKVNNVMQSSDKDFVVARSSGIMSVTHTHVGGDEAVFPDSPSVKSVPRTQSSSNSGKHDEEKAEMDTKSFTHCSYCLCIMQTTHSGTVTEV